MSNENRPVGSVRRRLDVSARVADHEGVAVEDLDEAVAHCLLLAEPASAVAPPRGLGKSRWRSTSSLRSPAQATSPRSTAAIRFSLPLTTRSKGGRSTRRTQSAAAFLGRRGACPCRWSAASARFACRRRRRSGRCPSPSRAAARALGGRARRRTPRSGRRSCLSPPRSQSSRRRPKRRRPDGVRGITRMWSRRSAATLIVIRDSTTAGLYRRREEAEQPALAQQAGPAPSCPGRTRRRLDRPRAAGASGRTGRACGSRPETSGSAWRGRHTAPRGRARRRTALLLVPADVLDTAFEKATSNASSSNGSSVPLAVTRSRSGTRARSSAAARR